jgi:ABC-type phosphate/phosphonate transport system substrate-binding protein
MKHLILAAVAAWALLTPTARAAEAKSEEVTLVVMDPMALELSCPCVKGYAQRNYNKLAAFLTKELGRPVKVHFADNLTTALKVKTSGKADLLVGKDSVVRAAAKTNKIDLAHVAALTDKAGKTTQTGLWVVAAKDPALTVADLKGHELLFGNADAREKYEAAIALLKESEVKVPEKVATCGSCSDAAAKIMKANEEGKKLAAVISSYAQPLLEGCGTVKKGDLRVIGETDPVPFVSAFVNEKLSTDERAAIQKALLAVAKDCPPVCLRARRWSGAPGCRARASAASRRRESS